MLSKVAAKISGDGPGAASILRTFPTENLPRFDPGTEQTLNLG
jgi:hypothetical protein